MQIYGHGKQTRSFQYVSDLVDGLIALMTSNYTLPVNLGNPTEYTIEGKPCVSIHYTFIFYNDCGISASSEVRHQWLVLFPLELFFHFVLLVICMWSQDSVVSVMSRIQSGQLRNHGSIHGSGRDLSMQTGSRIQLASYVVGNVGSFPRG